VRRLEASTQQSGAGNGDNNPYASPSAKKADDPQEVIKSGGIDRGWTEHGNREELRLSYYY
jgi:hypothetical protein